MKRPKPESEIQYKADQWATSTNHVATNITEIVLKEPLAHIIFSVERNSTILKQKYSVFI
jgi:hypothetical protein